MAGGMKLKKISFPRSMLVLKSNGAKKKKKNKRTIVVGLKSHDWSRELLLQIVNTLVKAGDTLVAIHVQETGDNIFDPNTFHIYEDLCKHKKVNFYVKVCGRGASLSDVLTHHSRLHLATILVLGCTKGINLPKDSLVASCLKGLPPTCTLMIMDKGGRILREQAGAWQQGSRKSQNSQCSSLSSSSSFSSITRLVNKNQCPKTPSAPSSSTSSPLRSAEIDGNTTKKAIKLPDTEGWVSELQRLSLLDGKNASKHFTLQELARATDNFSPYMVIGEGGRSVVYRANLTDGRAAAVKVLKISQWSGDELLREVEILSGLHHKHIIQLIGYSYSKKTHAIVYNQLKGSLKQNLSRLTWEERMRVAIGAAKALDYLHHTCSPPIIHRDIKSSNILLCNLWQPQLSDFGAAMLHNMSQQQATNAKFFHVVGTFGYLAPEYVMYGKVDEKTDVYAFGVVLLELITGKEAIQTNPTSDHESLVLWARSLLSHGLCERLIDPCLEGTFEKDEMQRMMVAARLCLVHSSCRRPTMKMILKLLEEPKYWIKLQRERKEPSSGIGCEGESGSKRQEPSRKGMPIQEDNSDVLRN